MHVLFSIAIVVATLISVIVWFRKPVLLMLVLAALSLGSLALVYSRTRSKMLLVKLGVVSAICIICEIIGVRNGVWRYSVPGPMGLPLWLPFGWIIAYTTAFEFLSSPGFV